jgi:hypothetical protein
MTDMSSLSHHDVEPSAKKNAVEPIKTPSVDMNGRTGNRHGRCKKATAHLILDLGIFKPSFSPQRCSRIVVCPIAARLVASALPLPCAGVAVPIDRGAAAVGIPRVSIRGRKDWRFVELGGIERERDREGRYYDAHRTAKGVPTTQGIFF